MIGESDLKIPKRPYIEIFLFLTPHDLFFTVSPTCKNFYYITWEEELLKWMIWTNLGLYKYEEMKYKLTKLLLKDTTIPSEQKGQWIIVSSDSENSDS